MLTAKEKKATALAEEAELDTIIQEAKKLETPFITTEEAFRKIAGAKNIYDLIHVWRLLKYEGLLSQDLYAETAKRLYLALINAAFRCNDQKECYRYYREAQGRGLADGVIHRTMFRISAHYQDIENLNRFYSILKERNEVEPMDHYQAMRTLNKQGCFKEAGKSFRDYMRVGHPNSLFNQVYAQKPEEVTRVASVTLKTSGKRR